MKMLLLAPHQDDEILGAGGFIQQCIGHGVDISVLFATNGDRFGAGVACRRYDESRDALAELGIPEDHIFYMGYGDTGMAPAHSFLFRLQAAPANEFFTSYVSTETYHPAGKRTVRALRTGTEGPMSRESFLSDLSWAIQACHPDFILNSSVWDAHGDHAALALLSCEILPPSLPSASYIIHGGDDAAWPQRHTDFFQKPPHLPLHIWQRRIVIKLSDEQRSRKRRLTERFFTQTGQDASGFLLSFAKREEVFFPWRIPNRQKR